MKRVYLDNAATTKIAPEVLDAMLPYLREEYGNPSSAYSFSGKIAGKVAVAAFDKTEDVASQRYAGTGVQLFYAVADKTVVVAVLLDADYTTTAT